MRMTLSDARRRVANPWRGPACPLPPLLGAFIAAIARLCRMHATAYRAVP